MLNRALSIMLLVVLVLLPLLVEGGRAMYWSVTEVLIYLMFAAWVVQQSREDLLQNSALKAARWPIALLAAVCLLMLLQVIGPKAMRSIDTHATWVQLHKSISYLFLFILTLALVNTISRVRALLWTLCLSGTFQSVYAILETVHTGTSATGFYVNRDHLAGYLEMTLAAGIGLLMADLNRSSAVNWRHSLRRWINVILGPKSIVRICLVLMVIALIMTHSRMGNTAFFSAMLIAGVIGLIIFRRSSRGIVILFASMIIIDTLLMGTYFGLDTLKDRIEQTRLAQEDRTVVNRSTVEIIAASLSGLMPSGEPKQPSNNRRTKTERPPKESPGAQTTQKIDLKGPSSNPLSLSTLLWGSGAGTYYTLYPQLRDEKSPLPSLHAHNDYFEFSLDLGAVGALLLATIMVMVLVTAIRAQRRRRARVPQAAAFTAMMAGTALMIHSVTDFNLQMHANAATFIVIISLPFIAMTVERRSTRRQFP